MTYWLYGNSTFLTLSQNLACNSWTIGYTLSNKPSVQAGRGDIARCCGSETNVSATTGKVAPVTITYEQLTKGRTFL